MQAIVPARAIAVAPLSNDIQNLGSAAPSVFPYGITGPPFYQPSIGFQTGSSTHGNRTTGAGSRSGVCASRHMAAEQRRRARINERLDALRGLVPHSARANTAAFLTEVYEYISALHKQLERCGGGVIDLNVAATDGKEKIRKVDLAEEDKSENRSKKRSREGKSEDDESEVESEHPSPSQSSSKGMPETKALFPSVSGPSSLSSSPREAIQKTSNTSESKALRLNYSDKCAKSAFSPASTVLSTLDTSLSVGPSTPTPMPHMTLVLPDGEQHRAPSPQGICELAHYRNANSDRGCGSISTVSLPVLPTLHQNSVSAAAAAVVADAAAAAQSWGMAAAVAHAQAQVAAQVHAQAQAMVQAQASANAQHAAHTQHAQVQVISGRSANSAAKRRKRVVAVSTDSCAARHRQRLQGIVRPIALKPQR